MPPLRWWVGLLIILVILGIVLSNPSHYGAVAGGWIVGIIDFVRSFITQIMSGIG